MIDASLPVQKAIRTKLAADVTEVAGRIYDAVPVSAVKPYLSFGPFDVLPEAADCSQGADITLQIDGWATGPDTVAAKRLGAAVAKALHFAELPLDEGQRLVILSIETVRHLRDPDGITAHTVVTVRAQTEPLAT